MERIAHPVSKANAQCELCKFNVSLLNMGEKALHSYAARKKLKKEIVRKQVNMLRIYSSKKIKHLQRGNLFSMCLPSCRFFKPRSFLIICSSWGMRMLKWRPNQWFWNREKSSKSLKKTFFEKKNSSSLFVRIWSSKRCAGIFLSGWFSRYLSFGDFKVPKNCFSQ